MTDGMKCPFCSEEIFVAHETMCVCKNDKCRAWGCAYPKFILTALIDGKKAQDALKESARIMQGLFGAMRKSRIGTTYAKMDGQSTKMTFGDYKTEAAQWLFDNFGVFWKDATNYLTDEQKVKLHQQQNRRNK